MSSPAETSQTPAAPTEHTGFDPIEFWYLHKTKLIALALLLVTGLAAYSAFSIVQRSARESAVKAFAAAKTADDFRKVIADHSGQPAAANARLHLAELQRKDGKLDDAVATLRSFVEKHPEHPLLAGAWLSQAQIAEAQGKTDDALTAYQKVLTTFPGSFAVPISLLAQGRLQKAKGQPDLAKRSYEQVITQFQNTPFQMEAQRELAALNKP